MSTDNALDALTARMLEAVKNTRESADSAAASAQQAQKMAEGEMQGTSLTGAEKKLLVQILQRAANKNSEMQPAVDELKKLWKLCRKTAAASAADADSCHHGSLLHCEIGGMDLWHGVPYRSAAV